MYLTKTKYLVTFVSLLLVLPLVLAINPTPEEPNGVPRVVVAENFTEWGCPPCAGTNPAWYAALENLGYDIVVPAMIHVWWPAGGDPIYNYDIPNNQARIAYYSVSGVPDRECDGRNINWNQAQAGFENDILAAQARDAGWGAGMSPVQITSVGSIDEMADTGSIDITVSVLDALPASDYRLITYLWEDNITRWGNPNGETINRWGVWGYYPDANGVPIFTSGATPGQFHNQHFDFTLEADWNESEMGMTILVQDFGITPRTNYNILQGHAQLFNFVNTPPVVEVLDNNGQAEDGTWASTQTITWSASDPDQPDGELDVMIEVSNNGGGSWAVIENGVDNNDGMCTWDTTAGPDSTNYLIRVSVWDDHVTFPEQDLSDTVFTVDNLPTIDLTSPDGGEIYAGGSAQNIQWNMNDFWTPHNQLVVDLYYSSDGGATYPNTIATGLTGYAASPCTYVWDPLPVVDNTQMRILAVVTDTDTLTDADNSLGDFEIDSTAPAPASNVYAVLEGLGVRIYWDPSPSADVDHYEVWWRMNNFDPTGASYLTSINAGLATDVLHANVGINNPNSYTYQVRTYDVVGHETVTIIQGAKYGSTQSVFSRDPDWFMLGNPLSQMDDSLANVIQGQGLPASYDCLRTYHGQSDMWSTHVPGSPVIGVSNIPTDTGFWMHISASTRFCTAGIVEDKVIDLYSGWNFVAYPFAARITNTATIDAHLTANCPGYGGMLIEDLTTPYHLKVPTGTENVFHNQGFFVYVNMDTTWTVISY